MEFTIAQISKIIKGKVEGDSNLKIGMIAGIKEALSHQITFLSNPAYENYLYKTRAAAVIVKTNFTPKKKVSAALIFVDDPYSSFTKLMEEFHKNISYEKIGVEEPSYKGKNSMEGELIYRGAFSYIGNQVTLGNNVKIYPHAYIGDNVVIDDDTIIHAGAKIYASTRIGKKCIVHSGAVIGSDGFGFAPQKDGSYKSIPQLGKVIINDNVVIGANTVIDCATLHGDATTIQKGVKLDNLIQIAHNVEVGEHTVIAAQTGISGSSKIGKNCILAGQVGMAGHLSVADNTTFGAQAGIIKSVKDEGKGFVGSPTMDIKEYFKSYAVFKKLPEMTSQLNKLEKKIEEIIEKSLNAKANS